MIISIDSGSTVAVYSDADCTTKVKDAVEKKVFIGNITPSKFIDGKYYNDDGSLSSSANTRYEEDYISVESNGNYYFIFDSTSSNKLRVHEYDANQTWLRQIILTNVDSTKISYTASSDASYIRYSYPIASGNSNICKAISEFWVTDLINREYYIKATKNTDERIIPYTITEYGVYRISMSYSSIPAFTYINDGIDGEYEIVQDDDTVITDPASWRGNWKIRFLTSGILNFTQVNGAEDGIDVFLVGGGGGSGNRSISGGGGGGYTASHGNISVSTGIDYKIVVGAGGVKDAIINSSTKHTGGDGGASSAFGESIPGGKGGVSYNSDKQDRSVKGGDGGSGGAGSLWNKAYNGGSNGGNGNANATENKGIGQGTSTREFYSLDLDATAKLYSGGGGNHANDLWGVGGAGGGGGNGTAGSNGTNNLGGGASGFGFDGGSGIVIIRNARSQQI